MFYVLLQHIYLAFHVETEYKTLKIKKKRPIKGQS